VVQRGGSNKLTMRIPKAVSQRNLARRTGWCSHPTPPSFVQLENSQDDDGVNRTHQHCRCWSYSLRSAVSLTVCLICDTRWRPSAAATTESRREKQLIVQRSKKSQN